VSNRAKESLLGVNHTVISTNFSKDCKEHGYFVRNTDGEIRIVNTTTGQEVLQGNMEGRVDHKEMLYVIHRIAEDTYIIGILCRFNKESFNPKDNCYKRGFGIEKTFMVADGKKVAKYDFLYLRDKISIRQLGQFSFDGRILIADIMVQNQSDGEFQDYERLVTRLTDMKILHRMDNCRHIFERNAGGKNPPTAIRFNNRVVILPEDDIKKMLRLNLDFSEIMVYGGIEIYNKDGEREYRGKGGAVVDYKRLFYLEGTEQAGGNGRITLFSVDPCRDIECLIDEKRLVRGLSPKDKFTELLEQRKDEEARDLDEVQQ
jgi:hypothetical protein